MKKTNQMEKELNTKSKLYEPYGSTRADRFYETLGVIINAIYHYRNDLFVTCCGESRYPVASFLGVKVYWHRIKRLREIIDAENLLPGRNCFTHYARCKEDYKLEEERAFMAYGEDGELNKYKKGFTQEDVEKFRNHIKPAYDEFRSYRRLELIMEIRNQ